MSTLRQDPPDPLLGRLVGSYRVERKLGEGGMGAVYELCHPGIGKRLALKVLHAQYALRPDIVRRFFDEARAVNLIQHPNIVDIIDFAQLEDGRPYLTMEFLEGESLASRLARRRRLEPAEVRRLVRPIASALSAAHRAGIVHRDLKPDNIFLVATGGEVTVKVLDFGIAKLLGDAGEGGEHTATGVIMGTPSYMSPEQAMGQTHAIDARTDVYALGVMIFEMLSGQLPLQGASMAELVVQHATGAPRRMCELRPELPLDWDALLVRALAHDPAARFRSPDELVAELPGEAPAPRSRRGLGLALALGALVAGGAALVWYQLRPHGAAHAAATPAPIAPPEPTIAPRPTSLPPAVRLPREASTPAPAPTVVPPAATEADAGAVEAPARGRNPPHDRVVHGSGHLRLTASPWAEVVIDGKSRGHTPLDLELPVGRHRVHLVNRELGKDKAVSVEVRKDESQHVDAPFE